MNFVKSKIAQKKTTTEDFNNEFLNNNIPKVLKELNMNSERQYRNNRDELYVLDKVKDILRPYKQSF